MDPLLLSSKAEQFQTDLLNRHVGSDNIVFYKVNLDMLEETIQTGRYPSQSDTPMYNGIWATVSAMRHRCATTQKDTMWAYDDCDRALQGLELLMDVTGVRGLLARLVRFSEIREGNEARQRWYPAAWELPDDMVRYRWRGEVSVDQYANGLIPAVWECRELFPERCAKLIIAFADHLLENDFQVTDRDGERTRFGDLRPSWNAIGNLTTYATFTLAAYFSEDDDRYAIQRDKLRNWAFYLRSRITNFRIGAITNPSNDNMAMSLYRVLIPLARETNDPAIRFFVNGMNSVMRRTRKDGNALFKALYMREFGYPYQDGDEKDCLDFLERFPPDRRRRGPDPRVADLPMRWLPGRKWRPLAKDPVPIEWRAVGSYEWKSSPYRTDGSHHPKSESTGLDYLNAYWALQESFIYRPI